MRREGSHVLEVLRAESDARRSSGMRSTVIHVSVNPPPHLWDEPSGSTARRAWFHRLRSKAYRVARRSGMDGGAVVFHRRRCADRADPFETDGPHFHVIGFGWIREDAFTKSGWVVRNHGPRAGARAVLGTVLYVLSHCHRAEGISQEGNSEGLTLAVTYFGRSVRASEIEADGPFCPLCERSYALDRWIDLEWVGQGPPPAEPVPVDWSQWRAVTLDRTGEYRGVRVSVLRR